VSSTASPAPNLPPSRRRFLASAGALALAACAGAGGPASGRSSGYAEVNGTRLYYEVAGTGEPVILVHAFTLDTRMWNDQFEVLARDFRVIRYDARGFGRSAPPKPGESYSNAEDLAALADRLDARKPHIVGLSMGGRFVLDYAVTYPDGLRSLVAIDGVVGGWQWSREWLAAYAPIVQAGRRGDVAQAKSLWLGLPLFAPARQKPEVEARLKQMVDDYSGWHFVNQNPERAVTPPAIGRLGTIRVPTLVLVGERDLPDFQRTAERLEREIPGARRATIAGAGHMANMEAPDAVNKALAGFLTRAS